MRRIQNWYCLFLCFFTVNFIHAQNISIDVVNHTATIYNQSTFVSASAIVSNHSPEKVSIIVKREILEGKDIWINGIGINDHCYEVSLDEVNITLEPYADFTLKSRFLLLDEESNTGAAVQFMIINSNKLEESISFITKGINGKYVNQPQTKEKDNHIRIFPNPALNYLNIDTDEIVDEIEIFDATGRSVLQNSDSNKFLDITTLTDGFFTLVMKTNNSVSSYTFIKQ